MAFNPLKAAILSGPAHLRHVSRLIHKKWAWALSYQKYVSRTCREWETMYILFTLVFAGLCVGAFGAGKSMFNRNQCQASELDIFVLRWLRSEFHLCCSVDHPLQGCGRTPSPVTGQVTRCQTSSRSATGPWSFSEHDCSCKWLAVEALEPAKLVSTLAWLLTSRQECIARHC